MNQAQLLDYAQTCLILILKLSLIPIIVATVVGLIVSLLQALTQIQEQTLGFAVKLITISITLMVASSWMGSELLLYTQDTPSSSIPSMLIPRYSASPFMHFMQLSQIFSGSRSQRSHSPQPMHSRS